MEDRHDTAIGPDALSPARRRGQFVGPVTTAGAMIAALGATAYLAGWQLGWIELMVVAAGCAIALLIAVPFVLGRSLLAVDRRIDRNRIEVGDELAIELVVNNSTSTSSRPVELDELLPDDIRSIPVPGLAPGAEHRVAYQLRPERRCRLIVGPAVVSRSDPLGLLRRDVAQGEPSECWVYPRTSALSPLPVGFAKDLEGPTSEHSPVGDVAFHAVRPYADGDDRRHIHWLSTARSGELMVRHYVDNRRPHLATMLDDAAHTWSDESFETAVSIAASLTMSTLHRQLPFSLKVGSNTVAGATRPASLDQAMEHLTLCGPNERAGEMLAAESARFVREERTPSALALIVGERDIDDLLRVTVGLRRRVRVLLIAVRNEAVSVPGATTICVRSLDEFASAWAVRAR